MFSTLHVLSMLLAAAVLCASCNTTKPCSTGTDVRLLDDSGVPQWLKDEILYKPEPMIGKYWLPGPNLPLQPSGLYPSGKVVVIRAAAADWPSNPSVTKSYIENVIFGDEATKKSIRRYYSRNSYGDFLVSSGGIPSWITLPKKLTDYAGGDIEGAGAQAYLTDVLKQADVDWSILDINQNGELSRAEAQIIVLIPNAMPNTGFSSVRYPAIGVVATPQGTFDFGQRPIVYFSVKATADPSYQTNPIRNLPSVAHELGHAFFNLPDRYGPNTGTGLYDIMTNNTSWRLFTMHDRMNIGWIQPKILNVHLGQCLQFVPSEIQQAALVLVTPDVLLSPLKPLEYWVIENRSNNDYSGEGYDSSLPDAGLAIWYVAEGTYAGGHNDVRLVDFSKPDQDPDLYNNPGSSAFFKVNLADPKRLLLNRKGEWTLLWFQNVSGPGLFVYGEF